MRAYLDGDRTCVFQWDNNRRLTLDGFPAGCVVAYSNECATTALVVESYTENGILYADIPPEIMQKPHCIEADIRMDGNTIHKTFVTLIPGPRPDDYVMEPVEILRYESLAKRITALEEGGVGGVALDPTLTQSGKAADAKATGDEIKRVEGLIPSIDGLAKTEDIPTKPEDIGAQPEGDYATPADIPNVPSWAMQTSKPAYTASEVGADPSGTAAAAVAAHNGSDAAHPALWEEIKRIDGEIPDVSRFVTRAVSDLVNYYTKSDTYTRAEIKNLISAIPKFAIQVVPGLPATDISATTIYLVPSATGNDLYSEYIYVNGAWEILGAQRVDLTGYALESWVTERFQPKGNYLTEHQSLAHLLPRTELDSAINTALTQARDSGEFDGEPGADGRGIKSIVRTSGNGAAGTVDTYTITYTDDTTSTYQVRNGANGAQGPQGIQGEAGKDGADGADGVGISKAEQTTTSTADGGSNVFEITLSNGSSSTFTVKNGSKGSKGDKGDKGATGEQGPQGPAYTLTEADKQTITAAVVAALPKYAGEVS